MKIIFSETQADHHCYLFPYQVLLVKEKGDKLKNIYQKGFLPFRNQPDLFYLARSSRADLSRYRLSSENKRVIKKTDQFSFSFKPLGQMDYQPKTQKACKDWAAGMGWKIGAQAIKRLFKGDYFNWALTAREGPGQPCYYAVLKMTPRFVHWAYSFRDPGQGRSGLTIRAGLEIIKWAAGQGKNYVYLGTAYGKTNYKRGYPGFEFFNGLGWSDRPKEFAWLNSNLDKFPYSLKSDDYKRIAGIKI